MFRTSLESMAASTGSKLGSDLEAIWQEVIDYRDKDLKDVGFDARVKAIQTFFNKKSAKRFMDTVYKHTGLNIEAVFFKPHFETSFCTWMCYGKSDELTQNGTLQLEGILNGQANSLVNDWLGTKEFTVEELIQIAKSYDIEKGIIRPEMRLKMKKWIRCCMGFDLSLGFLSKDYLPKNAGTEYLTARELTAIMLHEIGHNLTMVEHAADMYAHTSAFNALRDAFIKRATPEKAIELGKRVSGIAQRAGYVKDAESLMKAVSQAEKDVIASGKKIHKDGTDSFIFSLVGSAFVLLADTVIKVADVLVCDPTRMTFRTATGQRKKLGDIMTNDRMFTWQERKADEYAFTNGYGADQVTALEKIMRFYSLIGRDEKDIRAILKAEADDKNLSLYTKLRLSYTAHVMMGNAGYRLYPPGSERYREILNVTIKELKAHGASAEYVSKYVADIERILRAIDEISKEDKYLEESYQRYKMFLRFTSIRSFISWFTHGRCDTELQDVINNVQRLNNNLLTFFGFKLQQQANKA